MSKPKSANGVTGHLLYLADGSYCFRVYGKNHTFVDYDLRHYDLCVTIKDKDAFLYKDATGTKLDHSPLTLGKK